MDIKRPSHMRCAARSLSAAPPPYVVNAFARLPFDIVARIATFLSAADVLALSELNRATRCMIREPSLLRGVVAAPAHATPRPWESPGTHPLWEQLLMQALLPKRLTREPLTLQVGVEPFDFLTRPSIGTSGRYMAVAMEDRSVCLVNLFDKTFVRLPNVRHDNFSLLSLFDQEDLLLIELDGKGQVLWDLSHLSAPLFSTVTQSDEAQAPWFTLTNQRQHVLLRTPGMTHSVSLFAVDALRQGMRAPAITWSNVSHSASGALGPDLLVVGASASSASHSDGTPQAPLGAHRVPFDTMEHWDLDTLTCLRRAPAPLFMQSAASLSTQLAPWPPLQMSPFGKRIVFGPAGGKMFTWSLSSPDWKVHMFTASMASSKWQMLSAHGRYFAIGSDPIRNDFFIYDFAARAGSIAAFSPGAPPLGLVHFSAGENIVYIDSDAFDLATAHVSMQPAPIFTRLRNPQVLRLEATRISPFWGESHAGLERIPKEERTPWYHVDSAQTEMPPVSPDDAWAATCSKDNIVLFALGGPPAACRAAVNRLYVPAGHAVSLRDRGPGASQRVLPLF